jgi:prophage DNA circulation protein
MSEPAENFYQTTCETTEQVYEARFQAALAAARHQITLAAENAETSTYLSAADPLTPAVVQVLETEGFTIGSYFDNVLVSWQRGFVVVE